MFSSVRFAAADIKTQTYTHTTGSDFDNKLFTGPVAEKVGLANKFNRIPELNQMKDFLATNKSDMKIQEKKPNEAIAFINEGLSERQMGPYIRKFYADKHTGPNIPAGDIPLHGKSLKLFEEADSGHAFTGVVRIQDSETTPPEPEGRVLRSAKRQRTEEIAEKTPLRGPAGKTYKIFLAPLKPSIGSAYDDQKAYAVKEHDSEKQLSFYSTNPLEYEPLHHRKPQADGYQGPTAHSQLARILNRKESNKNAQHVAFTVVKGKVADGTVNQYTFTSGTMHLDTFKPLRSREAPREWQFAITDTFDKLSLKEWANDHIVTRQSGIRANSK